MSKNPMRILLGLAAVVALAFAGGDADAATKYSVASGQWEATATWNGSTLPGSTDDVIIMASHLVELGNTTVNTTYTINSLEIRPNGRIWSYNGGTGSWRTYIKTSANGPSGYALLNRGLLQNQVNRTSAVEVNGHLKTDGSAITSRTSQYMGGFSYGVNNVGHSGNPWAHNHTGSNGDSTPGICLILTGGNVTTPATIEQVTATSIDTAGGWPPSLDALPRTFIKGTYRLLSNVDIYAFENRVELGGNLDLNGYRLLSQGPMHVGDPGFNSVSYSVSTSTKTFTALSSGTYLWQYASSVISYTTAPKQIQNVFPSDWVNNNGPVATFNYYGQNVKNFWVSVNGWMGTLSSYANSYPYIYMPNIAQANGVMTGGSYYQQLSATGHGIRYAVVGTTVGSREFVMEWAGSSAFYLVGTVNIQYRFQIRLQESTNRIQFHYGSAGLGNPHWGTNSLYMMVGIEDQAGANAVVVGTPGWPTSMTEPGGNQTFIPTFAANPASLLRIGNGTGTANLNTWPQFRITAGASNTWGSGATVLIPTAENGSMQIGSGVVMIGTAKLRLWGEPVVPVALQNGRAPTCWIIGNLAVGGTAEVDIQVASPGTNPTNATLQVGQDLSFEDRSVLPALPSQGRVIQTGNHGATGFPVVLVQNGVGGGATYAGPSRWVGTSGGITPGSDTAGWTLSNSTLIHQGGIECFDAFKFISSGGNPTSVWGLHSIQFGTDSYQFGAATITIANRTDLAIGGPGTAWSLTDSAMSIKGNRKAVNGGGGNLFVCTGATFQSQTISSNMPATGGIGMVDVNGNLQVTGTGLLTLGGATPSTMRVLGQGTIPPGQGSGPPALQRQAPLGNLSLDDGGSLQSPNAGNVLVFIGEKWHSASVTLKAHPWKVTNLISSSPVGSVLIRASGGSPNYTYSFVTGFAFGTLNGGAGPVTTTSAAQTITYTAPVSATAGTAVIRVRDNSTPQPQTFDAVVTFAPKRLGNLMISPGYESVTYPGYVYYLRSDLGTTANLRAFGGSNSYTWSRNGPGTLSATSGAAIVFTAGTGVNSYTSTTVTLNDGTNTRSCYLYYYWTTYSWVGEVSPHPYYFQHLRVGDTQRLVLSNVASGTPSWAFTSNPTNATLNGGTTATGTSVTFMCGTKGGLIPYDFTNGYTYGTVTSVNGTGSFSAYVTALPSDLTISPTGIEGWIPGSAYTFSAQGGTSPYTFSLSINSGSSTCTGGGSYVAGPGTADDEITLADTIGVTQMCVVRKGLQTPANGNQYFAAPGAKTIFTNSSGAGGNSVDQIVFADLNDDFGRFQVLKTLATGRRVLPSAIEISPILLTVINGTTQTFTASGGATPYAYAMAGNPSGGAVNASTGVYTAGSVVNTTDTVQVTDAGGKIARATVNVVNAGGSSPLEIRPRYIYYFAPGQQFTFRTTGGIGGIAWTLSQNGSGGSITSGGVYTPGTPGGTAQDTIQVSDAAGNVDYAWVYVWAPTTTFAPMPYYCLWDLDTGAGKTLNGFAPGQVMNLTTFGLAGTPTWTYTANGSGGTLVGNGATATWTAGNTGNTTDTLTVATSYSGYFKVLPPPMSISPSQASVFGGTVLRFSASGGTGNFTYSISKNNSGSSLSQSGTPAVGLYTSGLSPATDIVRISDGTSWADVSVSVLGTSNPTTVVCSQAEVYHGELDLNGRQFVVNDSGFANGRGDFTVANGGVPGATSPTLTMRAGAYLETDRAFTWNPGSVEQIYGGTLRIGGSFRVTDTAGTPTPFDLQVPATGPAPTSQVIWTGLTPDMPVASPTRVEMWRATVPAGGGAPTVQALNLWHLQVNDGGLARTLDVVGPVCVGGVYTYTSGTLIGNVAGSPPAPVCGTGTGLPPGFQKYTNATTQPLTGTITNGVWIRAGDSLLSSWIAQGMACWVVTGTVTIQGGLVIENGCVDVQGTLTVLGDVYVGIGNLTQDRLLVPTLRMRTGLTPTLNVRETAPGSGVGGTLVFNAGASEELERGMNGLTVTQGVVELEMSLRASQDPGASPATNRLVDLNTAAAGTNSLLVRFAGQGVEAASGVSPAAARIWLTNAGGAAATLHLQHWTIAKNLTATTVDLWSRVDVHGAFTLSTGTLVSSRGTAGPPVTAGWPLHLLGTWTTAGSGAYDVLGTANWAPIPIWVDGTASQVITSAVPVPTVYVNNSGGVGTAVTLSSALTATNWYVVDGTFDASGQILTVTGDVSIGGILVPPATVLITQDRANAPAWQQTSGASQVRAGRDFLFWPGAVEDVRAGVLEAGRHVQVTDDPGSTGGATNRVFDLTRDLSGTVQASYSSRVQMVGAATPSLIYRQTPASVPQLLEVVDFTVAKGAGAVVQLASNLAVWGAYVHTGGRVESVPYNASLTWYGSVSITGGQYGPLGQPATFAGAASQTLIATVPGPAMTVNKVGAPGTVVSSTVTVPTLVGGNLWVRDGHVVVGTGADLRVSGNLTVGGDPGGLSVDRTNAAQLSLTGSGLLSVLRVSAGVGGSVYFFGGAVEFVTGGTWTVQRDFHVADDTGAGGSGIAFDLTLPAVATNTLVFSGPDATDVWRTDQLGAGKTLNVQDLTFNKSSPTTVITLTTPVAVAGTMLHQVGTLQSGTLYVNGPTWTTASGALFGPTVAIVVQGTTNQVFSSTSQLPNLFINKSAGTVTIPTGSTLVTGHFTIWDGTVQVNGGTLEVHGNFSVGQGPPTANYATLNATAQPTFVCTSATGAGVVDVRHTAATDGNFQFFENAVGSVDAGTIQANGDYYVNDAVFTCTGSHTVELRNARGAKVTLWGDRPVGAPLVTVANLTLNKSGATPGSQVDVFAPVVVTGACVVSGSTVVNGGPLRLRGAWSTTGTASYTASAVVWLEAGATQVVSAGGSGNLPVIQVVKTGGSAQVSGAVTSGSVLVLNGTLDLAGGTLTVRGFLQVGNPTPTAGTPPRVICATANGGGTLEVQAPGSAGADGTLYWFSDAQATVDTGVWRVQGSVFVNPNEPSTRPYTFGLTGSHLLRLTGNRGTAVQAGSAGIPTGYTNATLLVQNLEVAKTGTGAGAQVDLTLSDVAVAGTFTLTSGVVNTDTGSGAFVLRLLGGLTTTGGSFTATSWVGFVGTTGQTLSGSAGTLPNVLVQKPGTGAASAVVASGTPSVASLIVLDGRFDVGTGTTSVSGAVTVGGNAGGLSADRTAAPEIFSTSTGTLVVGGAFNFWAGAVETLESGTLRVGGTMAVQEDPGVSPATNRLFDLIAVTVLGAPSATLELTGGTTASVFNSDPATNPRVLPLWDVTVTKTGTTVVTATSDVLVGGTYRQQGGRMGTAGTLWRLAGAWLHTGGGYVVGSTVVLEGPAAQTLPGAATVGAAPTLPGVRVDKPSASALVTAGQFVNVGSATAGELLWVRRGTLDVNGGTLTVGGVVFVGDAAGTSQTPAPSLSLTVANSVLDVNASTTPPSGFSGDGDVVVQGNGPSNTPATATPWSAGTLRVEHRLAIDVAGVVASGTVVVLDGNAGAQGAGEVFSTKPVGAPTLGLFDLTVAKSGGGTGATARLLSSASVSRDVLVSSGAFDLGSQPSLTVGRHWTVAAAGSVVPTITPVTFSGAQASVVTVNSGAGRFFDVFVSKSTAGTLVTLTSTASPLQSVVAERQVVVTQGTAVVAAGRTLAAGAGSWVGNVVVGQGGAGNATLEIQAGASLVLNGGSNLGVDQAAVLRQVGTGAAARSRVTSTLPGTARYNFVVNGQWVVQWSAVESPDLNGVRLGATASVTGAPSGADLGNSLWDYPAANAPLLDLFNLAANLPTTVQGSVWQNSAGVANAVNVRASGSTPVIRFLQATGTLAGEAFDSEPVGPGPVYWNAGTLTVTLGASTPPLRNVLGTVSNVGLTQWTLTETGGESVGVTSLTLTATAATANSGNLRLYRDADGSGTLTVGDTLLGSAAATWTSGTVTFTGTPLLTVGAGASVDVLVLTDLTSATGGAQYGASIVAGTAVVGTGSPSGLAAQIQGTFPVAGNLVTVTGAGSLSVVRGAQSAPTGTILVSSTNVAFAQFVLTADVLEAQTLTSVTFQLGQGTSTALSNLRLYRDSGTSLGVLDAGDVQLGSAVANWSGAVPPAATFGSLTQALPAGGSVTVLLVQDVGASATGSYRVDVSAFAATGGTSGNPITVGAGWPAQGNVQTVGLAGTLTVALGASTPATGGAVKTATGVALTQLRVQPSAAEGLNVTQLIVTHVGTAVPTTAVTIVRLSEDTNGDGQVTTGEPQLGTGTYSGTTATLTLTGVSVPAGAVRTWLVVYDLSGNGTAGQTLSARVAAGGVSATGQVSGNAATVTGLPVTGNARTLTDAPATLVVAAGPQRPAAGTVSAGTAQAPVNQVTVSAGGEAIGVTSVTVSAGGTVNDATGVVGVRLYLDNGTTAGVVDAGDSLLAGPLTYSVDNGTVTFSGSPLTVVAQGTTATLLVTYDFSAAGVSNGQTVTAGVTAVSGTGQTSLGAASVSGVPVGGNVLSVAVGGGLTLTSGPRNPAGQTVTSGTVRVPLLQVQGAAGAPEDVLVTQVRLTQTSGAASLFTNLLVYWDSNQNGLVDLGEPLVSTSVGQLTGSPVATVTWNTAQRVSAGAQQTWVVVGDVAGGLGASGALSWQAGDVQVTGLTSGLTEQTGLAVSGLPVGGGVVSVGQTGSATVYLGARTSPARTELAGTTGIPAFAVTLRGSPAEAGTLTSLTLTASGTGHDVNDLAASNPVQVYVDANASGTVDAGETLLGQGAFSGDNGTLTLGGLTQAWAAGADVDLVVTLDLDTPVTSGLTFRVGVSVPPLQNPPLLPHVQATGVTSGLLWAVAGAPVTGNPVTVDVAGGLETLLVQAGQPWPSPAYVPPPALPASDVPMLPLRLSVSSVGPVWVSGVTLWPSGTGNDAGVSVKVWNDVGTVPGRVDAGDTLLGSGTYPGDNAPWTLALSPKLQLTAGSSQQWLVTHTVNAGTWNDTFEVRLAPAADVAADDNTATPSVSVNGSLLQGPTLTLASPPTLASAVAFVGGSSGGGCFIATAAAGPGHLVGGLTQVRDDAGLPVLAGVYYRVSPPLAAAVGGAPGAAAGIRGGLSAFAGGGAGTTGTLALVLALVGLLALTLRRPTA